MTISEAAQALNMSVDGIRKRIQRKTIKAKKDKQGRWIVEVDTEAQDKGKEPAQDTASIELIQVLKEQNDYLRQENERKDHIIMSLTNRLPQLEPPKRKTAVLWPFRRPKPDNPSQGDN